MQIFRRIKGIPEPEEPQDQASKRMIETERAMSHEEASKTEEAKGDADSQKDKQQESKENFKTVLEQQTLRELKDAENAPPKGRFSNLDLKD